MNSIKLYKTIYFTGVVFIFVGGYRLFKNLEYGVFLFSAGMVMYSAVQLKLLFHYKLVDWTIFEYLKATVNLVFLLAVILLVAFGLKQWYYPFILGLLLDFFANILKRISKS